MLELRSPNCRTTGYAATDTGIGTGGDTLVPQRAIVCIIYAIEYYYCKLVVSKFALYSIALLMLLKIVLGWHSYFQYLC